MQNVGSGFVLSLLARVCECKVCGMGKGTLFISVLGKEVLTFNLVIHERTICGSEKEFSSGSEKKPVIVLVVWFMTATAIRVRYRPPYWVLGFRSYT